MDNEGYKKRSMVLVVASGRGSSDLHARFKTHVEDMQKKMEKCKIAMINIGEAGRAGATAGLALSEAFKKLPIIVDYPDLIAPNIRCPPEMIETLELDFSRLERIVLDSMTIGPKPTNFAGRCYDESGEISKKTYKKLLKKLDKEKKTSHKQDQTDRWCNKWDRKIKRKL